MDNFGISLKMSKIFIRYSPGFFSIFYELCKAMAYTGLVPKAWKIDIITFLFKKKGERINPKNWRPITIAPSLGKHFEKVLLYQLKRIKGINPENHAYIEDRSCLTAVLALLEFFNTLKIKETEARKDGYLLIPILMAEDVSSAFESIDHESMGKIMELLFDESSELNMGSLIRSYLDRVAWILDRKSGEKVRLDRRYQHKTAPQGSSLSPYLWRFFDAIFTKMFKDGLTELKNNAEVVDSFFHVAYADDHVTVVVLKVKKDSSSQLIGEVINLITTEIRNMLDLATKAAGCGINPDKSELVMPQKYTYSTNLAKDEFVWLGYSLKITNECKLPFT